MWVSPYLAPGPLINYFHESKFEAALSIHDSVVQSYILLQVRYLLCNGQDLVTTLQDGQREKGSNESLIDMLFLPSLASQSAQVPCICSVER